MFGCAGTELFPGCTFLQERFLGMTKSYIAFRPHP
jgi:hypothetical protein